jgi:hypothetical protein
MSSLREIVYWFLYFYVKFHLLDKILPFAPGIQRINYMTGIIFLSVQVRILAYFRPLWETELITSLVLLTTNFPRIRVDPLSWLLRKWKTGYTISRLWTRRLLSCLKQYDALWPPRLTLEHCPILNIIVFYFFSVTLFLERQLTFKGKLRYKFNLNLLFLTAAMEFISSTSLSPNAKGTCFSPRIVANRLQHNSLGRRLTSLIYTDSKQAAVYFMYI